MRETLITAHSGCDNTTDNSLAFLIYALTLDVDNVEVDVRLDKKENLIMSHNVQNEADSLQDAFELLQRYPNKKINCDLKTPKLEQAVCELANEMGVVSQLQYSGEVSHAWIDENPDKIEWLLNAELLFPEIYSDLHLFDDLNFAKTAAEKTAAIVHKNKASCINISYKIYESIYCRFLIEKNVPLSVWTPSTDDEVIYFLSEPVYNITTRNAAFACKKRNELFADREYH